MNKQAFLDALAARTEALSEAERSRAIAYFTEIIDDGIEDGLTEEAAVAALGDVDALASELLSGAEKAAPARVAGGATVESLRNLDVRVQNADVTLKRAPLDNGAAAQVQFSHPERFTWRMDGDTLVIEEKDAETKLSFLGLKLKIGGPACKVAVTLSGDLPGGLTFAGYGGDLEADGLRVGGAANLKSGSGDLNLWNAECGGDVTVQSGSGDIALRALCCAGLRAISGSGDIEIDRCQAASVQVKSGSGDVRADEAGTDGALAVETGSGDIEIARCAAGEIQLTAASGDIEAARCHAPLMRINTASGDIDVRLDSPAEDCAIHATTATGDISLPEHWAQAGGDAACQVYARTASGDINVSFVK